MAPRFFGLLCDNLNQAGFKEGPGWKRIIVEKPFGTDLESALQAQPATSWRTGTRTRSTASIITSGKETVQNLLAFRFSNGMFEPLWNKNHIDNIQFNVAEAVDVEGRGGYYDSSGVLRDMMQNHMFQMLAYLCMETPGSFQPDAIRNEKAKLLQAVRVYTPEEVARYVVRGQYGPNVDDAGKVLQPGYRQEKDVNPGLEDRDLCGRPAAHRQLALGGRADLPALGQGALEARHGNRGGVQEGPAGQFRGTSVRALGANRLIFHIQPYQGIEIQFQAKIPGPTLQLQPVHMRFGYGDAFKASRYTGYEVMLYSCTRGDATLFSRGDLVEAAWRVAQPLMDYWEATPAAEFPNYARGSWGPKAAADLVRTRRPALARGRHRGDAEEGATLQGRRPALPLAGRAWRLRPQQAAAGQKIIEKGAISGGRCTSSPAARSRCSTMRASGSRRSRTAISSARSPSCVSTPRMANVRRQDELRPLRARQGRLPADPPRAPAILPERGQDRQGTVRRDRQP